VNLAIPGDAAADNRLVRTPGGRRLAFLAGPAILAVVAGGVAAGAEPSAPRHAVWSANRPDVVLSVRTRRRMVALSFDDGPNPRYTPAVLAMLRRVGAHATFFDTGEHVARYPELARRTVRMGNEVGNHTWDHPKLPGMHRARVLAEVRRTSAAMRAAHVRESDLFRPPYGAFDGEDASAVRQAGHLVVGWDLCVEKELRGRTTAEATARLLAKVHPGSIILAHDAGSPDRARTLQALPLLLDGLRRQGYRVVTIGRLLRA